MTKEPVTLASWLAQVNKDHGPGSVMQLGDEPLQAIEVIPTGSIALDEALGVGGLPRGRIIECFGPESSGKTSLALEAAGHAQRLGLLAGFIDAEHALDPKWAETLGVKAEKDKDGPGLILSQPDHGEQALDIAESMARSGLYGLIIVDSVAALVPKAEIEGQMGDSHIGLQARLMSQALRKLNGVCFDTKTTIVFINQLREKVGVFFGSSEVTTGGKALTFYASVRLDIRRMETLKDGVTPVGNRVRIKVVKNKVAAPFRTAERDLMFGEGFSYEGELITLGTERGVLKKSGSWHIFEGAQLGNGKEATRRFLIEHPDAAEALDKAVRAAPPAHPQHHPRRQVLASAGPAPWEEEGQNHD